MDTAMIQIIGEYGAIAIFIVILLEYACFPISSELVLPLSGVLSAQIHFPFIPMLMLSVLAGVLGSLICYSLGRFGGEKAISKILRKFPKMTGKFQRTCALQEKYGKWAVMMGRVIPIFRTYISFVSGLTLQNIFEFIGFSAIGILFWNSCLLGCGYFFGENFDIFLPVLKQYLLLFVLLIVLLILLVYFIKQMIRKKNNR